MKVSGQTPIFDFSGGGNLPQHWTGINKNTQDIIEKNGFWLLESGQTSDSILTSMYTSSRFTATYLSFEIASFGNGTLNRLKVEVSYDSGRTFPHVFFSVHPDNGTQYKPDTILLPSVSNNQCFRFSVDGTQGRGVRLRLIHFVARDYFVDLEGSNETKTAYSAGNVTLNGKLWSLDETLIGTSSSDFRFGSRALRFRGYSQSAATMLEDLPYGIDSLFFTYWMFETDNPADWQVQYSTNQGSTWQRLGNVFSPATPATPYHFTAFLGIDSPLRIRIVPAGGTNSSTNRRMTIDNIRFTDYRYVLPNKPQIVSFETRSTYVELKLPPLQPGINERILLFSTDSIINVPIEGNGSRWRAGNFTYGKYSLDESVFLLYKGSDTLLAFSKLPLTEGYFFVIQRSGRVWSDTLRWKQLLQPVSWAGSAQATAWYNSGNWSPQLQSSDWRSWDWVQFGNSGNASHCGINMATSSLSIAGISLASNRNNPLQIGNSSQTQSGVLQLNGATIGIDTTVVLANFSNQLLEIVPKALSGTQNMTLSLAPISTFWIDSLGGISINVAVNQGSNTIVKKGKGSGVLEFKAVNENSTRFVVEEGRVLLSRAHCFSPHLDLIINGGECVVSSNQTIRNLSILGGKLVIQPGVVLTIRDSTTLDGGSVENNGTLRLCKNLTITTEDFEFDACKNIVIDSNSQVKLTRDIVIQDTLFLQSGNLELGEHTLTARRIICSDQHLFIKTNGLGRLVLHSVGQDPVVFPVGNMRSNYLTITNNTGTTTSFSVKLYDSVTQNGKRGGAPLQSIALPVTWDIKMLGHDDAASGNGIDLVLGFSKQQMPSSLTAGALYHYEQGDWNYEGPGQLYVSQQESSFSYTQYKGTFSPFSLQMDLTLLALPEKPILSLSFDTLQREVKIQLISMDNLDVYDSLILYHVSDKIPAKNIGQIAVNQIVLHSITGSKNAYWIKGFKGQKQVFVSPWQWVYFETHPQIRVYPIPVLGDKIRIEGMHMGEYDYAIYSVEGRQITKEKCLIDSSYFEISMGEMRKGIYYLVLQTKDMSWKFKILKE